MADRLAWSHKTRETNAFGPFRLVRPHFLALVPVLRVDEQGCASRGRLFPNIFEAGDRC
ncbi:MAG: hypothetical protein UU65_C0004G0042 [candidate division CPR2 bacterium GW2011_GWC1_41_48]|uniref:Uncharacterized protein n=1 Tax=candidate division CPR2 bacterium GW2011_GWC1_41_48 TaxID=1618344 RepID=A0A0G0YH03_UNCC2|nr:MAG: hypothetical protein UT47_C0004G0078 [candidate division CPR2 bacterium GW2011_GWC2_39_35]KKR27145.1 MAG: hypothetical protein UT60_C0059G0001 [candidate division CPR2 bacterium GW2011_GWD2_39_7]KKR27700.1 MAG: hypothetical protein UT59_C0047G0001 [candidate division CPR2 bacterium GW2011_GWD1_39_7]KKS08831.1 MAG: hypothetical protein UU65_C0004G0042 [candidate division CPR2 bacterium GW2011_GWC1_41_48]